MLKSASMESIGNENNRRLASSSVGQGRGSDRTERERDERSREHDGDESSRGQISADAGDTKIVDPAEAETVSDAKDAKVEAEDEDAAERTNSSKAHDCVEGEGRDGGGGDGDNDGAHAAKGSEGPTETSPVNRTAAAADRSKLMFDFDANLKPAASSKAYASAAIKHFTSPATILPGSYREDVGLADRHFKLSAVVGTIAWLALLGIVSRLAPPHCFEVLPPVERNAAALAFAILLVSSVSRIVPLVYSRRERAFSGVICGSVAVQTIALITDALLAFVPTPVLVDPITQGRVHLIRWCEWAVVSGIMTFLIEGVDLPHPKYGNRIGLAHALAQSASTFCGLLFPMCPNGYVWGAVMVVSCALYSIIFVRLRDKWAALRRTERGQTVDEQELHDRLRLSFKLMATCAFVWTLLIVLYFVGWMAPRFSHPDSVWHSPAMPMLTETFCEIWSKVLFLLIIIDVHRAVFDDKSRAERRLGELRQMMSAVWETSSDVITISVRSVRDGSITTMVSPTFPKLEREICGQKEGGEKTEAEGAKDMGFIDMQERPCALVFELGTEDFVAAAGKVGGDDITVNPRRVHFVPLDRTRQKRDHTPNASSSFPSSPSSAAASIEKKSSSGGAAGDTKTNGRDCAAENVMPIPIPASTCPVVYALAELVVLAWNGERKGREEKGGSAGKTDVDAARPDPENERLLMHDFNPANFTKDRSGNGPKSREAEQVGEGLMASSGEDEGAFIVRCEAKVTRIERHGLLMVVRDITERFRRFEAEKKVMVERTARQKDAEANRFTRHEVKNGLLAAIGLCDSLREAFSEGDEGGVAIGIGKAGGVAAPVRQEMSGHDAIVESSSAAELSSTVDPPVLPLLSSVSHAWQHKLQDSAGKSVEFDARRCMSELDSTLREVLDTILAQSMARDVVHGVYEPKVEKVDIYSALYGVRGGSHQAYMDSVSMPKPPGECKFPIVTYPSPLPMFLIDPQLLRFIHRNAISNAIKYGKKNGVVETEIRFDTSKADFQMNVINLPGEYHDTLLKLGSRAEADVFLPGRRFHPDHHNASLLRQGEKSTFDSHDATHSSGDGAWIMRKCADTLGGTCSIRFEESRTVFSLRCPARPVANIESEKKFRLPRNTWGVAIDDSKIQRKLLERIFNLLGIEGERCIVLGKDADEIIGFDDTVVRTMRDNPNDYVLLIADENLDVMLEWTHHTTISGSSCVERIRGRLETEEERRLLALVRSANDSSEELAVYNSRAHGFFPKAPIQRDKVLEIIEPLWTGRFWGYKPGEDVSSVASVGSSSEHPISAYDDSQLTVSSSDLMQTLEVIDALCMSSNPSVLAERWPAIWEKLHILKGDTKTLKDSVRVTAVLEAIDRLQGAEFPEDLIERWGLIRSLVVSIM